MYAPVSSPVSPVPVAFDPAAAASPRVAFWTDAAAHARKPDLFVTLIRNHHRTVFHLAHSLLRDEVAAEKITQQVFSRARKHMDLGPAALTEWIYYAALRFVRMCHWRSVGLIARRRMRRTIASIRPELDLKTFVRVIARHPGKVDPRDCELLALRYVLGMPLGNMAQLLRMHPQEVFNRLSWALARVHKLGALLPVEVEKPADLALSA
jgi:DNA-directed RNA polymerase specialized sigma24 family protein